MGKRSTGRKLAMQALYQVDIRKEDADVIIDTYILNDDILEDTKNWAIYLIKGAADHLENIDSYISKYAVDWDIKRLNLIDKSILRLAFYELLYTDTMHTVVIDEAIELSKKFSTDESPKFINGILGTYIKKECSQE